jgi:tetratricopeptide (TPR) repeat protein
VAGTQVIEDKEFRDRSMKKGTARKAAKKVKTKAVGRTGKTTKKTSSTKTRPAAKTRRPVKKKATKKKATARAEDSLIMSTGIKNRKDLSTVTPAPETPPRLLRDSKSTAAALKTLEKAIKLIYQKDFPKARSELDALIANYPLEAEIIARARSYIQICDREEARQKKSALKTDQLYSMGVMEHNSGNYDKAISHFRQTLLKYPDRDYIHYSLATSLALKQDVREAIQSLQRAIELNEDNRIYARNDSDFSQLHTDQEFADLIGLSDIPDEEPTQS